MLNEVICSNCGERGHVFRVCTHPVSSYGILCFRIVESASGVKPEYLMVQRKDSLGFVEFVRGKYNVDDDDYIGALFSNMTRDERTRVSNAETLDVLWSHLWREKEDTAWQHKTGFFKDLEDARRKFETIRSKIGTLMESYPNELPETEWGLCKGRRSANETNLECALREFGEESGLNPRHLKLMRDSCTVEEMFRGSNGVWYRHIYYVAKATAKLLGTRVKVPHSNREIRACEWYDIEECLKRIRPVYTQRRTIMMQVHAAIIDSLKNVALHQLTVYVKPDAHQPVTGFV